MFYLLVAAAGIVVGWFSALLGIGGGVLMVPVLYYFFKLPMSTSVGTSLAVIIPTALMGACKHYKLGHVNFTLAVILALGAVIGAYFGAQTTAFLPDVFLRKLFGVVLLLTAVGMLV